MTMPDAGAHHRRPLAIAAAVLGLVLLVVELPFYLAAGLVAPLWAVIVGVVFWVLLATLGVFWFRRHPYWVLGLPVVGAAFWLGLASLGEVLGWTA